MSYQANEPGTQLTPEKELILDDLLDLGSPGEVPVVNPAGDGYDFTPMGGNHNDLAGLQGGASAQYYHLTAAEKAGLEGLLYTAPTIVLATTPTYGVREFGNTSAQVALSATTNDGSLPITSVKFYRGATLIDTVAVPDPDGGVETFTDTTDLETTTSYSAKVGDGETEVTSAVRTFTFVYPYLYGVGDPAKLASSMYADFTKAVVTSGNKTYSFSPTEQVYYFCYPASYGELTLIEDPNGFPITTDWTLRQENITGLDGNPVLYNIYEFNNLTTQTGFAITFTL